MINLIKRLFGGKDHIISHNGNPLQPIIFSGRISIGHQTLAIPPTKQAPKRLIQLRQLFILIFDDECLLFRGIEDWTKTTYDWMLVIELLELGF